MISPAYRKQVDLILRILPFVAENQAFALKGGTAINLFVRDFPRLSVDIDLTYVLFDDRDTALKNIKGALRKIKVQAETGLPNMRIAIIPQKGGEEAKLTCELDRAQIKIEVNTVMRGCIAPVRLLQVSDRVQDEFGLFAAMNVVSHTELYGGKICAALDRQHPRDLFDIHQLLASDGLTPDLRLGFLTALLSSPRPIHELLSPKFIDQRAVFDTQFAGMTEERFDYGDFLSTRETLVKEVCTLLTETDWEFLISFAGAEPDWLKTDIEQLPKLPAVKWKLANLRKLQQANPDKLVLQQAALADVFQNQL